MAEIARGFSEKIHAQAYPLSEFWSAIVRPDPVIMTLLQTGVAVYDTGFFVPIQLIYRNGNIIPTRESIDANIANAEALLLWADDTLSKKLSEDLFRSVVAAGQALLMEEGYLPPVPKEVSKNLMAIAVEKTKLLSKEDVDKLDDVVKWFKRIEHGEVKSINGDEYSKQYLKAKEIVDKILKTIDGLREKKGLPKPIIDKDLRPPSQEQEKYIPKSPEKKV
jgi:hypothetical protein